MITKLLIASLLVAAAPADSAEVNSEFYISELREGRCHLVVDGSEKIDGPCHYEMMTRGQFILHGPRENQNFTAYLMRDDEIDDHNPTGFVASWNGHEMTSKATAYLGPVAREGACWINERLKMCLWKS